MSLKIYEDAIKKLKLNWTIDTSPRPSIWEDAQTKTLVQDMFLGKTVFFYDFFGLVEGVVLEENFIRSGGSVWKAERIKDGWFIAYGYNEEALSKLEITE